MKGMNVEVMLMKFTTAVTAIVIAPHDNYANVSSLLFRRQTRWADLLVTTARADW